MLEFYFQFRFRPHYRTRYVILHLASKFHRNRTIISGDMIDFHDGCRCGAILLPVSDWLTSISVFRRSMSTSKPNFEVIDESESEL